MKIENTKIGTLGNAKYTTLYGIDANERETKLIFSFNKSLNFSLIFKLISLNKPLIGTYIPQNTIR